MSFTHPWFVVSERPKFPPNIALFISIVAVSTASILIRMSAAGPLAIAAYRLTFATLILLPFYIHSTSLGFTSVASSVVFVHVDPIFVAAVSHFVFKERINRGTLLGIVFAFAGAIIIALGDAGVGEVNLYGDLLALVGAIMLGIYILSGRRLRQSLDLVSYVTPVYATSAVVLILGSLVNGTKLAPFPMREYLLFLAIAVVPMIFGHTVYNWALKYVEAPVVSISLLGEPVGATILAYLVLREVPNTLALVGGVITLLGIYLCVRSSD